MSAPCRYLPGTTCDRNACDRTSSCPGPVDLDAPDDRGDQRRRAQQAIGPERQVETKTPIRETPEPIRETKPAAPATVREEEETMPSPVPQPAATCPECKRPNQQLYNCKAKPGDRYCSRCNAKFAYREKNNVQEGAPRRPAKPAAALRSAPAVAAPKAPAPAPIAKQGAAQGQGAPAPIKLNMDALPTGAAFIPLTARSLAEALQVEKVRLLVTCRTTASVLAVLRATESDGDVMIERGAGAQG